MILILNLNFLQTKRFFLSFFFIRIETFSIWCETFKDTYLGLACMLKNWYIRSKKVVHLIRTLFILFRKRHWINPKFCKWNIPKMSKNSCSEMAYERHSRYVKWVSVDDLFKIMFEEELLFWFFYKFIKARK